MVAMTPDKWKRLRWAAIKSGFGFLVFVIALYFSFPYERAKEVAIRQAAAKDLDVEIGSAGFAFGLGVAFHDIRVRTRPTTGKPTRFTIERAKVSFSPWSLLPGAAKEYAIDLDAFGGKVDIDQVGSPGKKTRFNTLVQARDVNMAELPGVKEAINLPLGGTLRLDFNVKSDTGKYADASGDITFTVSDCVLGDGKTPLKVSGNAFLSAGLTLPRTRLGDLVGHVAIQKGVAKLQGVEAKSPDVELSLEGEVTLRDPLPMSTVNAYLRFKFSDAFLQKAPAVQTMLQLAGAQGKRADGAYGMKLGGRLGQLTSALSATSPVTGGAPTPRPVTRPSISPSSTLPTAVPSSAPPPPLPPPPPPAAEPPPPPPPSPPPAVEATPPPAAPPGAPQGPPGSGWRGTAAGAPPGPAGATDGPVATAPAPPAAAPTPEAAPAAPPAAETPPAPAPAPSE